MSKKLISFLLVVCLCISLLPVVALAEEEALPTTSLRILSWIDITAEEGGEPGYLKNKEYQGLTPIYEDGEIVGAEEKYKGWTQEKGDANNWNIKYEWPKGGTPVLTFKNVKLDHIGDDGVNFCDLHTDSETGESWYQSKGSISAILTKSGLANRVDLKIVFQGNNHIDVNNGILRGSVTQTQYLKNVTITGEPGNKVNAFGRGIGISTKAGYTLTLENLNLTMPTTTTGGGTPVPIRTEKADMFIKNCNITTGNEKNVAIAAMTSGNVTIENSTINVYSKLTSTAAPGCIYASNGAVTITNSKITAEGGNNSCIGGNSVTLNNCDLNLKSGYYSIYAGGKDGDLGEITINGGSLLAVSGSGAFWKTPIVAPNMEGLCGKTEEEADIFDETKYRSKWLKLYVIGASEAPTTEPTQAPTENPVTGETELIRSATVIKDGGANIWSKPSTASPSKLVRTVKLHGKVDVVAKKTVGSSLWYKLKDGNWVYSTNVRLTDYNPADEEIYNAMFVVTSWGANVWSKPYSSGDSKVIKSYEKTDELSIVARVKNSTGGLWCKLASGGWIYSKNVNEKIFKTADVIPFKRSATVIVPGVVNIWGQPSTQAPSTLTRTAAYTTKLNVIAQYTTPSGGLWYQLTDGNWVYSENVRITDYNPADVKTVSKTATVTSWGANVWSKPYSSGDSTVTKTVAKAAKLAINGEVRNSTYGLWYRLADGSGWIYSQNVSVK